jgi:hypothetical protein
MANKKIKRLQAEEEELQGILEEEPKRKSLGDGEECIFCEGRAQLLCSPEEVGVFSSAGGVPVCVECWDTESIENCINCTMNNYCPNHGSISDLDEIDWDLPEIDDEDDQYDDMP